MKSNVKKNWFKNIDFTSNKFTLLKSPWTIILTVLLAAVFSFFMIFGKSFMLDNSWNLVLATDELRKTNLLYFICYTLLFSIAMYIILSILILFQAINLKKDLNIFTYSVKGFLFCWLLLMLFWLPYIIAFYPGVANSDVADQLAMFYNFDNGTYPWVDHPIEGSFRHGHHPYFNTIMLGLWLNVGILFSSQNVGIFLHCICQTLFTTAIFSYIIVSLGKWKLSAFYRILVFIMVAVLPCFPQYGINLTKNTVYTDWLLVYAILLTEMVFESEKFWSQKLKIGLLAAAVLFQILHMKYGIHIVLISAVPVFIVYRKYWKKCCISYILPIVFYFIVFENILFPILKVAPGSEREKYSIPFQQTARYMREYGDEVTPEERENINRVLVYENVVAMYHPQIADGVKFHALRTGFDDEDMKAYLKAWFSMLWKHPGVYVEAAMNECFAFFYPGLDGYWTNYYEFSGTINNFGDGFFEIHHPEALNEFRNRMSEWGMCFAHIPVLKMLYRSPSYVWVLMWAAVIVLICKKPKYLIALSPMLLTIFICIVSPYNGNTRYALPIIYGIVLEVGIAIKALKEV